MKPTAVLLRKSNVFNEGVDRFFQQVENGYRDTHLSYDFKRLVYVNLNYRKINLAGSKIT